jgi:periplasmic divalent cation tolerance protein
MGDELIALITASNRDEAARIGAILVEERLAACVNVVPEVQSLFFWEGKARDEREALLIVKSRMPLWERLVARVTSVHSYTVPEIIALPIIAGSRDYLDWLRESTRE